MYFPNKINFLDEIDKNYNKTIQEIYQKLKVNIQHGGNSKLSKKIRKRNRIKKKSNKKRTKKINRIKK